MNLPYLTRGRGPSDDDVFAQITNAIRQNGYSITAGIFTVPELETLFLDIKHTDSQYFHLAGIGRDDNHQLNRFVRRDRIHWLEAGHATARFYFDWIEQLRLYLNRRLYLGLFDYECHYAHYPQGGFYKKHRDAFRGQSNRVLTTILYLNPDWQPQDGGELVLYADDNQTELQTISPQFGNMVIFLSEEFPHEVLPAHRSRYSLTGWYRVNNTDSLNLDPAR